MDDVIGGFVDLALHLNRLLLVLSHLDPENPEVGPPQIQRDEVPLLCGRERKVFEVTCSLQVYLSFLFYRSRRATLTQKTVLQRAERCLWPVGQEARV